MSDEYFKSLNGFKSWYASNAEHRSLEDKKKMLAEMEAAEDFSDDLSNQIIEWVREQTNAE